MLKNLSNKTNCQKIKCGCYNYLDLYYLQLQHMTSQIPPQLTYNKLYPKGFYSTFKQWQVQPLNGGNSYWPGQIVKIPFLGMANTGVFDPYKSHIQILVTTTIANLPVGQLRLDNSAQSFVQQLVINSGTRQIQRIPEYGILAAWLNDLGLSDIFAQGKQVQGLGYSNLQSIQGISWKPQHSAPAVNTLYASQNQPPATGNQVQYGYPTIIPTQTTNYFLQNTFSDGLARFQQSQKLIKGHVNNLNSGWFPLMELDTSGSGYNGHTFNSVAQYGYARNLRAQYINALQSAKFPQSTTCQTPLNIGLNSSVFGGVYPSYFSQGNPYLLNMNQVNFSFSRQYQNQSGTDTAINLQVPNTTSLLGFTQLASPAFMKGTGQPFISPTVPQLQMQYGNILPYKVPVASKVFKFPLMSAIMGILIPQSQFSLLPVNALSNLLIQLTLDPFAMFTSGYCDISQYDTTGMNVMQQRAFQVKSIVYNMHMYQFGPGVQQYVQASLNKQILFNTHSWTLANQYQLPSGQQLTNAWQVACQSQSLSQVLTLFVPSDYTHYTFCRKHFRLSNNIIKLQYRINMEYYPPQPIYGHAGNPIAIDSFGDNSAFLDLLYWSQNYHFQPGIPLPRINAYNFAINQRCYNVANTQTLYQTGMWDSPTYSFTASSINSDTAMGISDIHQNRYVGKAGYPFSFEPYSHSQDFMIGLDCRELKQFDVIITADSNQFFPRQQVMYIYTKSNIIISYTPQGIFTTGK